MTKNATIYLNIAQMAIITRLALWAPLFYHSTLRMIKSLSLTQLHF